MELILGVFLILALFIGGLLLSEFVYQAGETMEERRAMVFEVYRYAVCFLMVLLFGIMAFQLISALIVDANNTQAMTGPGVGVMISGALFMAHWFMKNPLLASPAISLDQGKPES
jgi:hypothetical protein